VRARERFAGLVAVCTVVCTACGSGPAATSTSVDWRPNARQVVQQLRVDIGAAQLGGTTAAAARRSLADVSHLYALLVAYSDLGGCSKMVAAAGPPPRVSLPLERACAHLQRAAALFARAAQGPNPEALARATRETELAQQPLVRAMLAIRRG